jgi:hypothetical protein
MGNWFAMAYSKDSPLYKYFARMTSEAIFKERKDSRQQHVSWVKETRGLTDEQIKRLPRSYWRRRLKYHVPGPKRIVQDLTLIFNLFARMRDKDKSGVLRPFLCHKAAIIFKKQMKYVKGGYLSDPPSMDMYIDLPQRPGSKSTVARWRCLRSTSAEEGYHFHLARCMRENARGRASELFMTLMTNYFDFRWNVDAAKRCGDVSWTVGHYNLTILDLIQSEGERMGFTGTEAIFPGWRQDRWGAVKMLHGHFMKLRRRGELPLWPPWTPMRLCPKLLHRSFLLLQPRLVLLLLPVLHVR